MTQREEDSLKIQQYREIHPEIEEAYRKYKRHFVWFVFFAILIPALVFTPSFIWWEAKFFRYFIFALTFNIFFITLTVYILISSLGFDKRLEIYNSILVEDPSARITLIKQIFIIENFTYVTDGKRFPKNFRLGFFPGGKYTVPSIRIRIEYQSPFRIYLSKLSDKNVFDTDNKDFLKFKDKINKFNQRDEIWVYSGYLFGDSTRLQEEKKFENLFFMLETMKEIIDQSNKGGTLIERSEADDTFDYWYGPGKATVCLSCDKIIGKWKKGDHANITKCPTCYAITYLIIYHSNAELKNKTKQFKMYK